MNRNRTNIERPFDAAELAWFQRRGAVPGAERVATQNAGAFVAATRPNRCDPHNPWWRALLDEPGSDEA